MSTNMEVMEINTDTSPASMIYAAIAGGADLDKLEKLMLLQERFEANEAKKAYVSAMAAFKADPPRIEKTKQVKFSTSKGTTEYKHALLADAAAIINTALSRHGLSAGWTTSQADKLITVTCKITHAMGHSEQTSLVAAPDDSGGKNGIQAIGSTVSYLERYTLFSLTGLASHDMDDDGRGGKVQSITEDQQNTLVSMMEDNGFGADIPGLLKYMHVEAISEIPSKSYNKALSAIKAKIKKKGDANE
jgi:hypothetical protein